MKIIKIFADYATSATLTTTFVSIDELFLDKDYNISYRFTLDDDYTHAIIINKTMPVLSIPKENVIGIAQEPPEFLNLCLTDTDNSVDHQFIEYVTKYVGKYYIGEKYNLPEEFIEHHGFVGHNSIIRRPIHKNKLMSLMISDKIFTQGHIYRHQLAKIIMENNLPIDIYGRGCKHHKEHSCLKGEFNGDEHIENYLFHISIENTQHPHYFGEKITNPLLLGTNVLYLGCQNTKEYFGEDGIHLLSGNIESDMNLIVTILNNWQQYYKKIDAKQVANKISIKNLINNFN